MKFEGKSYLSLTALFLALASVSAQAGTMGPVAEAPGNVYLGVFGGGGASTDTDVAQYGTAFYPELTGGPLAVNSFGHLDSQSFGMVGGQVGFQWTDMSSSFASWTLTPAFEAEGFWMSKSDYRGHEISNDTVRLNEHDFDVNYPMSSGVFLINSVLTFNSTGWFHPYLGGGIGGAVTTVNHAQAIQVSPPEVGLNHYNSNPSDKDSAFAGQIKVGTTYAFNPHLSVFAEYRWLYVAPTSYTFGSTVAPGHVATNAWRVDMDSQDFNMGSAGIRYTL